MLHHSLNLREIVRDTNDETQDMNGLLQSRDTHREHFVKLTKRSEDQHHNLVNLIKL